MMKARFCFLFQEVEQRNSAKGGRFRSSISFLKMGEVGFLGTKRGEGEGVGGVRPTLSYIFSAAASRAGAKN